MSLNPPNSSGASRRSRKRRKKEVISASFVKDTVKWLCSVYYVDAQIDTSYLFRLVDQLFLVKETRGISEVILWSKSLRSETFDLVSRLDDLTQIRTLPRRGFPRRLRFLRRVRPDLVPAYVRLLLTVSYTTRALTLPPKPDFTSIVEEPNIELDLSSYVRRAPGFWRALGHRHIFRRPPSAVRFSKFHLSTRSSPMGGNALSRALLEYLSGAVDPLIDALTTLGGPKFQRIFQALSRLPKLSQIVPGTKVSIFVQEMLSLLTGETEFAGRPLARRLAAICDSEGKTREVAILDYWSQTCLRPLHRYLFRCLRQIKQDCTFNQGSFKDKLAPNPGHYFYSFDLKSATNRFPIRLIEVMLRAKFGNRFVNAWRTIMVGLPFDYQGKDYVFATGNPLGAYSSWNSFTLAHHFVLYCCCLDLNMKWHSANYVILGDDIVIHDDRLAAAYSLAMKKLGVEINLSKSHVSSRCYEFAKRFIHNGTEITPFPINSLWESRRSPSHTMSTVSLESMKGWIPSCGIPPATVKFFEVRGYPGRFRRTQLRALSLSLLLQEALGRRATGKHCIHSMIQLLSYDDLLPAVEKAEGVYASVFGRDIYLQFLRAATYLVFRENFERRTEGTPLGLLPERLLLLLSSPAHVTGMPSSYSLDLIECIPTLGVYGQIEEIYLRILRDTMNIDFYNLGDWPLTMRALCLPLSDRVFFSKTKNLRSEVSGLLADACVHLLTGLRSHPNLLWYGTGRGTVDRQVLLESCPRIQAEWLG